VLIEQVDDINPEPLERGLSNRLDVVGPTVHAVQALPVRPILNPNFVAIATLPRKGASASPTSSSFLKRTVDFRVSKKVTPFSTAERITEIIAAFRRPGRKPELNAHTAQPEGPRLRG